MQIIGSQKPFTALNFVNKAAEYVHSGILTKQEAIQALRKNSLVMGYVRAERLLKLLDQ